MRHDCFRGAWLAASMFAAFAAVACSGSFGRGTNGRGQGGSGADRDDGAGDEGGQGGEPSGNDDPVGGGSPAGGSGGAAQPSTGVPPEPKACTTPDSPGPRLLRRLTGPQLADTVRDLFGDPNAPRGKVLDDPLNLGFRVDAALLTVRDLAAQQLMDYAEQVAKWAVTNRLDQLSSCKTNDANCRQSFIRSFGRRAFRAPLSDAQVKAYDNLFAAEASFSDGVEAVIAGMLQSPHFLYRSEFGKSGANGRYTLTPHEVASSLSYLLTDSLPDQQLAAAADAGALSTPAQIRQHAERLLADPRAGDTVMRFVEGWLGLDHVMHAVKDETVFKLTEELRKDMLGETRAFVLDLFRSGGTYADLLTAKHTFLNRRLGELYGVGGSGGDQFQKFTYASGQRDPGLLGHASLLAGHATASASSPVARGKLVRTRLLCQELPPPPAGLDTMLKPPQPGQSTRERFRQHSDDAACSACHKLMDPIGFGFEAYDAFGRRRTEENGKPVDTSGTIVNPGGKDQDFRGLAELASLLGESAEAKSCLARYWSYYAYGLASWSNDACTYEAVDREAARTNHSLKGVLLGIVTAPHFTQRVQGR